MQFKRRRGDGQTQLIVGRVRVGGQRTNGAEEAGGAAGEDERRVTNGSWGRLGGGERRAESPNPEGPPTTQPTPSARGGKSGVWGGSSAGAPPPIVARCR